MKVKCVNTSRITKEGTYQNLKLGKEYEVLAIEFYDQSVSTFSQSIGDFVLYRIRGDDAAITPYPASLFEITIPTFSSSWVSYRDTDGSFSILPARWGRVGFWNDYYNDDEDTFQDLINEERLMLEGL
jgi:hypothetical protein